MFATSIGGLSSARLRVRLVDARVMYGSEFWELGRRTRAGTLEIHLPFHDERSLIS